MRRGIPYKETNRQGDTEGLVFLCYQQDIGRQFEFQQGSWMNEPRFPKPGQDTGTDPIASTSPRE